MPDSNGANRVRARFWIAVGLLRRLANPGHRGEQTGEGVGEHEAPAHGDAGEPRGLEVTAHRVEIAPDAQPVQHDPGDPGDGEEDQRDDRDVLPDHIARRTHDPLRFAEDDFDVAAFDQAKVARAGVVGR